MMNIMLGGDAEVQGASR